MRFFGEFALFLGNLICCVVGLSFFIELIIVCVPESSAAWSHFVLACETFFSRWVTGVVNLNMFVLSKRIFL